MSDLIYRKEAFQLSPKHHYLAGHSLGPLPKQMREVLYETLHEWEMLGVNAWEGAHWLSLPIEVGKKIANLIGAHPQEVIVSDSTSVNLYKALQAALALNPKRRVILTEENNFPTDLYIAEGLIARKEELSLLCVKKEALIEHLNEDIAVLLLSHVNFRDSYKHAIKDLTQLAKAQGIIVIWDLSHSVGLMPLTLSKDKVDFAVGATYKYLNGGPGAPSFLYVNRKHHHRVQNPIQGWMGHCAPFQFENRYFPHEDARRFQIGTPTLLSLKGLDCALSLFASVNMEIFFDMNQQLAVYFRDYLQENIPSLKCLSPQHANLRGGHLAFTCQNAPDILKKLQDKNITCDFRPPHLLRFSFSPLYLNLADLEIVAHTLKEIMR